MPKACRKLLVAWLLLCGWLGLAATRAQTDTGFIVDAWSTRENLPQSSVISVIQTRDGYLWLGTLNGLVRFDGSHFTVFNSRNTPGLNSDRIVYLFQDSHTNLWIGTDTAGIALWKDGRLENFNISRAGHEGRLVSVCEDNQGGIWLYTADAHLARYANGKMDVLDLRFNPLAICRMLAFEKSGQLWVGEDWGLFSLWPASFHPPAVPVDQVIRAGKVDFILASHDGGVWRLANSRIQKWANNKLTQDLAAYPWTNVIVTAACEDKEGNLIVGTSAQGIFWFNADGKYQTISTAEGLSHSGVLSLCLDRDGNLWAGTDGGGLNRIKRKTFTTPATLRAGVAQSTAADATGGLWVTFNGAGATHWASNRVENFESIGRYPNAWSVLVDSGQRVWLGTRDEGLFQFNGDHFAHAAGSEILRGQIFALFEDRAGNVWAGAQNGLGCWDGTAWKLFTIENGLPENIVRAITEDAAGNLWIGTESRGLARFKDGKFAAFTKAADGLLGDDISCLCAGKNGGLWIGTFGHGLARLQNEKWTSFSTDDGLASDSIGYVAEDEQGDLWLGSNVGLMRVARKSLDEFAAGEKLACRTYTETDGLPTRECSFGAQPAVSRTADGCWWFPTVKGLVSVNPGQIKPNTQAPLVLIESVRVAGREQKTNQLDSAWPPTVTIPHGKEGLEIHYTGLNFSAPKEVRFRFRLEGHEKAWTEAGDTRVAYYGKLPPGEYRFHVIAANEDSVWNETGAGFAVTMQPWFWQTQWFLWLIIALALLLVVRIVRHLSTLRLQREVQLLKQQELLEKERSRIARDLHDQLGANLTQVALLGEMAEEDKNLPEEIGQHAQQISQTARETTRALDEIVWAANPANDTLEGLANYVCKYAQDYLALAGLRYRVDAPAEFPPLPLPPDVRHNAFLAFKESVNNVVKHAQASEAWIRLRLQADVFILEIEDDGRGVSEDDANKGRNGLRNMKKRMDDVHGEFFIGPRPGGGTIVRLAVPLAKLK